MLNGNIIEIIEAIAHPDWQASWDNTGMQTGSRRAECTGVLLCVDCTPAVVEEAHNRGCSLIISHHPLIFKGLKRLTGNTPVEEALMAAIRYNISIYSCHTAVDSAIGGVSYTMAKLLGAKTLRVIEPLTNRQIRISVTTSAIYADDLQVLLSDITGDSEAARVVRCETETAGKARMNEDLTIDMNMQRTVTFSFTVPLCHRDNILAALDQAPADVLDLTITNEEATDLTLGLGVMALFEPAISADELVSRIKHAFGSPVVRTTRFCPDAQISRLGLCGGSGGELIGAALRAGAQAYLSSDIRYHDFVDWQNELLLLDIGHYESEACTKEIFYKVITETYPDFNVFKSDSEINPINYQ